MRRTMLTLLTLIVLAICAEPQQAVVVELTKEESAKARDLYQRLTAAQAEWERFRLAIRDKIRPGPG